MSRLRCIVTPLSRYMRRVVEGLSGQGCPKRTVARGMAGLVTAGLLLNTSCAAPASETGLFTSTRSVSALVVANDGSLWAATRGGVLHRTFDGNWRKFTVADGLPSNEALSLSTDGDSVIARFPTTTARWECDKWNVDAAPGQAQHDGHTPSATWKGKCYTATLTNIEIREGEVPLGHIALPQSTGTHVSALLPRGNKLLAAMFGDGIWEFDGKGWLHSTIQPPPQAREMTCLADDGKNLWLGTRREGVWQRDGKSWTQHLQPDEPYDHNVQAICRYRGDTYFSTLEDGVVVRSAAGWQHLGADVLSSNSPRQMVEFRGCLYVRHGNGKIDRFDGRAWTRNVYADLPRKQASALASDGRKLYVAQWGGWSEFDGASWKHNLKTPDLQGVPITAILPDIGRLWIGTQGRGLAEVDQATGALKWHDERYGLPDDWIKVLAKSGDTILAGTFVGGLAIYDGKTWTTLKEVPNTEITAIEPDNRAGAYISTRYGIFYRATDGAIYPLIEGVGGIPVSETQALCLTNQTLWIGTRTGIYRLPMPDGN